MEKGNLKPMQKSGDATICYRKISLLDVVYKIKATLIKIKSENIEYRIEYRTLVGEYQASFRKGQEATEQIFIMKE